MSIKGNKLFSMALSCLFTFTALAQTGLAGIIVSPAANDLILPFGKTYGPESISVTLPSDAVIPKADIYILADTTSSMAGPISAVQTGAAAIIDGISSAHPGADLQFGAGNFKDFPPAFDPYCFNNDQSITADAAAVKTAIESWDADGGGDDNEGQFYAYDRIADPSNPVGWRDGAKKILVVFGDAPAHDPIPTGATGLPYEITEASVTQKLMAAGITFIGVSTMTGYLEGMDYDPANNISWYDMFYPGYLPGGTPGQATRIAAATGGAYLAGIDDDSIAAVIAAQITAAVTTINTLSLVPSANIAPFVKSITPSSYGPLALTEEQTKTFAVTFEGTVLGTNAAQVFTGTLDVMADGSKLGEKTVKITVPAGTHDVAIDIKPGSFPNSVNLKNKGSLPVAVLGSESFDVSTINPASVKLEGIPHLNIGLGLSDVNYDGYLDWVFHFPVPKLGGLKGLTEAELTGMTLDGIEFQGTDSVRILK